MINPPNSARARVKPKPPSALESLGSMKTFSVKTKIRTFSVKMGQGNIRGCYSRKEGNYALLHLKDFNTVMDKRKDSSSSSSSSSTSGEEEEESGEKEASIPSILEGIEVVYDNAWSFVPDASADSSSMVVVEKAKEAHEANVGVAMVRAKDVYAKLLLDGSIHHRRIVFGLAACLAPYVDDKDLCEAIRKVHENVASRFIAPSGKHKRHMAPTGCMLTESGCRFIDESNALRKQVKECRVQNMRAFTAMTRTNDLVEEVKNMTKKYAVENLELAAKNRELTSTNATVTNRLMDALDENKTLKHCEETLRDEMHSLTEDYLAQKATIRKLTGMGI